MHTAELKLTYSIKVKPSDRVQAKSNYDMVAFLRKIWTPDTMNVHEEFVLVAMDNRLGIIGHSLIAIGGYDSCVVDVRKIMATLLLSRATSFVLAHNHPSGNVNPSGSDLKTTTQIHDAARIMQIRLIDHVILTEDGYYSFAENDQI